MARWSMADVVAAQKRGELAKSQAKRISAQIGPGEAISSATPNPSLFAGFTFRLPWAPSLNNAYFNKKGGGGRVIVKKAVVFCEAAGQMIFAQEVPCRSLSHPLRITIEQHTSADRGDIDNGIKAVIDALKRYQVIHDDNRAIVKEVRVIDGTRVPKGEEYVQVSVHCVVSVS